MVLTIYWTEFAKNELQSIFEFYKLKVGLNIARKLVTGISQSVLNLSNQPDIGQKEKLLTDRIEEF